MVSDEAQVMNLFLEKTHDEKELFLENIKKEIMSQDGSAITIELLSPSELTEYAVGELWFKNPKRLEELRNLSQSRGSRMWDILRGLE